MENISNTKPDLNETEENAREKKVSFITLLIITTLLCLFPIIAGILMFDLLPDNLPMQFDFQGNPGWTVPKQIGIFLAPLVITIIHIITQLYIRFSKYNNIEGRAKDLITWLIPILSIVINLFILFKSAGGNVPLESGFIPLIAIVFIYVGNALPKIQKNPLLGIRLPWIMKNPVAWRKTHRLGGVIFVIAGFLLLIESFLPQNKYVFLLVTAIVSLLLITVYSIITAVIYKEYKEM